MRINKKELGQALRHRSGQAIVEVVLAAGIVSVTLTVLVGAVSRAVANNRLAKERVVATRIAQETVEWFNDQRNRYLWQDFCSIVDITVHPACPADISDPTDNLDSVFGETGSCNESRSNTVYNVVIDVDDDADCIGDNSIAYDVFVNWYSNGKTQETKLHSVLGKL